MKFDPAKHHRRSIRLKEYDYAQAGVYFVTICTQQRLSLFGDVVAGELLLNAAGEMVQTEWLALPQRFPNIALEEFVVMPNHFHGVVAITSPIVNADTNPTVGATLVVAPNVVPDDSNHEYHGAGTRPAPTAPTDAATPKTATTAATLGGIIGAFKSITTHEYIHGVKQFGWPAFPGKLWQRNYYEHVVRDEQDLARIRAYILNNSARWWEDHDHPQNWKK